MLAVTKKEGFGHQMNVNRGPVDQDTAAILTSTGVPVSEYACQTWK